MEAETQTAQLSKQIKLPISDEHFKLILKNIIEFLFQHIYEQIKNKLIKPKGLFKINNKINKN